MSYFKSIYFLALGLFVLLSACGRDNSLNTEDVVPSFNPAIVSVVDTPGYNLDTAFFEIDSSNLIADLRIDGQGNFVENEGYWCSFSTFMIASDNSFLGELDFFFEFDPLTPQEEFIQAATYIPTSFRGSSPQDIEDLIQWIEAGSDPSSFPNLSFGTYEYNASDIQISVSNIELDIFPPSNEMFGSLAHFDSATLTLTGMLSDNNGFSIPLDGIIEPSYAFFRIYDE